MGVFGKFKDFVVGTDDDDEDEYDDEIEVEEIQPLRKPESKNSFIKPKPEGTDLNLPMKAMPQTRSNMGGAAPFKMVVIEPKGFEDSPRLVDSLKARKPVIVNLEHIENGMARKIFDFLSGATYALGGNVQRVGPNIYVFTPENVDISTNIESSGTDFPEVSTKGQWR